MLVVVVVVVEVVVEVVVVVVVVVVVLVVVEVEAAASDVVGSDKSCSRVHGSWSISTQRQADSEKK